MVTPDDIDLAFRYWRMRFYTREDKATTLKDIRIAQWLTRETVAKRLGISPQAYDKLEKSEESGLISINKLSAAARALDCELQLSIRSKQKFSELIWAQILPTALQEPRLQRCRPNFRHSVLANAAARIMNNPDFRRAKGWTERLKVNALGFDDQRTVFDLRVDRADVLADDA